MRLERALLHIPSERRLFASLSEACEGELIRAGFAKHELEGDPGKDPVFAYCRVLHRSIAAKPRTVARSRELTAQLQAETNHELLTRVAAVEQEMRQGLCLNVRLSRKYYELAYNDPLLNDLNVHHFHLGARAKSPGKLCESFGHYLLFGVVEPDAFRLVHLGDHLSFKKLAFERVLFDNWPHLFDDLQLRGSSEPWPNEDRTVGRHVGLTMPVQIEGRTYLPRWCGQSTAGTALRAQLWKMNLIGQVRAGRKWILENSTWAIERMKKQGVLTRTLALEVRVMGLQVWFVDAVAGVWMCPMRGEARVARGVALELRGGAAQNEPSCSASSHVSASLARYAPWV